MQSLPLGSQHPVHTQRNRPHRSLHPATILCNAKFCTLQVKVKPTFDKLNPPKRFGHMHGAHFSWKVMSQFSHQPSQKGNRQLTYFRINILLLSTGCTKCTTSNTGGWCTLFLKGFHLSTPIARCRPRNSLPATPLGNLQFCHECVFVINLGRLANKDRLCVGIIKDTCS